MTDLTVAEARKRLQTHTDELAQRYWARDDVSALVADHTAVLDEIVRSFWEKHFAGVRAMALFAVGGYGREELHPGSDIDLLILGKSPRKHKAAIEAFLRDLYDLNIEIGHAVRTPKECRDVAAADITVTTALLEHRWLCGDAALTEQLVKALQSRKVWRSAEFFRAKRDEQSKRHARYDNVDYGLEPNVKSSPGGLRDYHTAMWVCLRHFGTADPAALVTLGALTAQEMTWLVEGRRFLWWVRFGLHLLAGRKEDRLQFEHQRELARRLGYADTEARLGVERFMHTYYRHVTYLREVNDILLQHFEEQIFNERADTIQPLTTRFQLRGDYIEAIDPAIFRKEPETLMDLFVVMANRRDIAGVRADTIRAIRDSLDVIDDDFRKNKQINAQFINLLKSPHMLVSTLTRMRRYGVLGRYIPDFGRVIGQMQHDLFHIYTVDAHTIQVIRNMRRFFYRSAEELYPVASHCVKKLPKIELLYIAGLFHDIAKGRGGDHSELGAIEVRDFCRQHGLSPDDTELVRWLVKKHLYMSSVAQREDIYDPDVVHEFAAEVKSERRLDYLYTLTVADINATNPKLWNSYRATLLRHLHGAARRALRRGLESPRDKQESITAARDSAREKIMARMPTLSAEEVDAFLTSPSDDFFLRHSARHIANIAEQLIGKADITGVWLTNITPQVEEESVTEVYLYTKDRPGLFGASTIALDKLGLSVFEASINTDDTGTCFNTYVVLDRNNGAIEPASHARLAEQLRDIMLTVDEVKPGAGRLLTRQNKQMSRSSQVTIERDEDGLCSILTIHASDRPGLLAEIGRLFSEYDVEVQRARINTLGDRVEDIFDVVNPSGEPYSDADAYELSQTIRQLLDRHLSRAL